MAIRLPLLLTIVFSLSACAGQSGATALTPGGQSAGSAVHHSNASGTLYVLNIPIANQNSTVSVFDASGDFLRTLSLGSRTGAITTDTAGHLFAAANDENHNKFELGIYSDQGANLVQSVSQNQYWGYMAVDNKGNLFTHCAAQRVCEYAKGKNGKVIKNRITRMITKVALRGIATDPSGNVAINTPNSVVVFAKGSKTPYWTISSISPTAIAFDSSGNLFVAQQTSVAVYAPKAMTPSRTITNGVVDASQLAFDSSNQLYVLNCAITNCANVVVYGSGSSMPQATISQGIVQGDAHAIAVDAAGDLAVTNKSTNNVVHYSAGQTNPDFTMTQGLSNPDSVSFGP
jgi:hypothetical protein